MKYIFDDRLPIYKQLIEQIKRAILTGEYEPGQKLPSVRELAIITKVNPNTIQRALTELEALSLITTQRTLGKFVTDEAKVIAKLRDEQAQLLVNKFISDSKSLGLDREEIDKLMKKRGKTHESN